MTENFQAKRRGSLKVLKKKGIWCVGRTAMRQDSLTGIEAVRGSFIHEGEEREQHIELLLIK